MTDADLAPDTKMASVGENVFSDLHCQIEKMNSTMKSFAFESLCEANSFYFLQFIELQGTDIPLKTDIARQIDDLEAGLQAFFSKVLADRRIYPQSQTYADLMSAFTALLLETLRLYNAEMFELSDTGKEKYKAMLNPIWLLSMKLVLIEGMWFMLFGDWYD